MKFTVMILITALLFAANVFFGAIHIAPETIMGILSGSIGEDSAFRFIILESRIPQALTALFAGAGLATAGLMLQTAFRNPLAGPSILGISSGASLGVALVTLLAGGSLTLGNVSWSGNTAVMAGAMAGSFMIMGLLIALSARIRNDLMLLITGIMTGYLASSAVTLLSSLSTADGVQSFVMWGMGTFGGVSWARMPLFASLTAVGLIIAFLLAKPLNILLLGDNYARNLGVNLRGVRNMLLLATGVLTATATAYCGPIAFIGLAMPHIARMIFRTDNHRTLLPATMLAGASVCLACNVLSVLPESTVIPVNALTPVVGVPVILRVILRKR